MTGYVNRPVRTVTASSTLTRDALQPNDYQVQVNAANAGGAFAETLPGAASCPGAEFVIKRMDSSTNQVVISDRSGALIEGSATFVLVGLNNFVRVGSDGTNYRVVGVGAPIPGAGVTNVAHGVMTLKSGAVRTIVFGDSITQSTSSQNAAGLWSQSVGYAECSIMKAGGRFRFVRNAGIFGNTTAQMLARIGTDVLAYNPDLVLFMGGTNDIATGMTTAQMTQTMNNIENMVLQMLRQGIYVVLVTPPCKETTVSGYVEMRQMIRFYYMLAQYYGLPLVDAFRICVNPVTGGYQAGFSPDGTHPGTPAIAALSDAVSAVLLALPQAPYLTYLAAYSETSTGNVANLLRNGSFAQQAAPPVPDGWGPNTTGVTLTSPTATLPYTGNNFNYQATAVSGQYALFGITIAPGSGWNYGDTLVFSGRIKTTGFTGTPGGYVMAIDTANSGSLHPMYGMPQNADLTFSMEFVAPQGCGNIGATLYVQDNATYLVNNLTLWNLSAAQAIWQPGLQ